MAVSAKPPGASRPEPLMRFFLVIWCGQTLSLVGSALVQFALIWWLTTTHNSARVLATAMMMEVVPRVLVSPFAGALVDRWPRRTVLIVADTVTALALVWLLALYASGAVQNWHVYLLLLLRATAGNFHWPAMQASTTMLVPERHLARVAGLTQTLQGLMTVAAPALGALLYELLPMQGILAVEVITAACAVGPLLFIAVPRPPRGERLQEAATSILYDLLEGLLFIWRWQGLATIMAITMVVNLVGSPSFALIPLLVSQHFGGGALQLGWVQGAFGVGLVLGGVLLGAWGGFKRRIVTASVGSVISGAGFIIAGLLPATAIGALVAMAFVVGLCLSLVTGSVMALMQAVVPPALQGRVFAVMQSVTGLTVPFGLWAAGHVGDAFGVQPWFVITGVVIAGLSGLQFVMPVVRTIEDDGPTAKG
jgi:DHA3 family macrolide efflux protein-like MFS transporter